MLDRFLELSEWGKGSPTSLMVFYDLYDFILPEHFSSDRQSTDPACLPSSWRQGQWTTCTLFLWYSAPSETTSVPHFDMTFDLHSGMTYDLQDFLCGFCFWIEIEEVEFCVVLHLKNKKLHTCKYLLKKISNLW